MSDLGGNKIIGGALATALVLVGLVVIVPKFFERSPPAHPGYVIAVVEEAAGGGEVVDTPPDWGTVLPAADLAAGEAKVAVCKSCHIFDAAGTNNTGPGLYGVVGRKPGSHPGFAYSSGMIAFGGKQPIWDYQHIYEFLKNPQGYVSGTKMGYMGMKAPEDRINVIAYLHSLGSSLPIPKPDPKAAAKPGTATPAVATPGVATPGVATKK